MWWDSFRKTASGCIMKLSDDTHSVWPQTFTISFNDGFLYLVVLHLGHPWSSIWACTQQKTRENVQNSQLFCYLQVADSSVTQKVVRQETALMKRGSHIMTVYRSADSLRAPRELSGGLNLTTTTKKRLSGVFSLIHANDLLNEDVENACFDFRLHHLCCAVHCNVISFIPWSNKILNSTKTLTKFCSTRLLTFHVCHKLEKAYGCVLNKLKTCLTQTQPPDGSI